MKNCKKILCLFLALVMCLGMLPMAAFADDTVPPQDPTVTTEQT